MRIFFEEQKNYVGWVGEVIGLCLTTCTSKVSKQKSSESLGREARTAQHLDLKLTDVNGNFLCIRGSLAFSVLVGRSVFAYPGVREL